MTLLLRCERSSNFERAKDLARKVVVVVRVRGGNSIPAFSSPNIRRSRSSNKRVAKGTLLNADEAQCWNALHARFQIKRINHEEAYSQDALARMRRRVFQPYASGRDRPPPSRCGPSTCFVTRKRRRREDNRRVSNGDQVSRLASLGMRKKASPDFTGYWQRHVPS
jgi:hypothetical protein